MIKGLYQITQKTGKSSTYALIAFKEKEYPSNIQI
jgi:hypothetical protein